MKNTILKFICAIMCITAIVSAMSGCTVKPYYEGAPEGMRPINEGENNAILYVPETWLVDTSTGTPTAYVSTNDRSMITLVTVKADVLGDRTIPEYWNSYKDTFTSSVKNFTVIKENETDPDYSTRLICERSAYIYDFSATVTELDYKFRQTLLTHPNTNDLYIITYSTVANVFDKHLDALNEVYNNFRFVTEKIPMADKSEVILPENVNAPEGYVTVSSEFVDYTIFIPKDWTPLINTGATAAHAPQSPSITVIASAFSTEIENAEEYWTGYEADLISTFGSITYVSQENKFEMCKLDGYDARKYAYTLSISGESYTYEQYMTIRGGYIYIITFCSPSDMINDSLKAEFAEIVSHYKFKNN